MCSECRYTPCHPRCPNYVPKTIFYCDLCGEPIEEGEEFYKIDNLNFHEDCLEDNVISILIENDYLSKEIAEEYE